MEQSAIEWFNKIEKTVNDFKDKYIEKSTELSTKLDSILVDHADYDKRLDELEKWRHTTEGKEKERDTASDKRFKKWGIIIVCAEVIVAILVGAGIKVIWG